jgi:hypothetical protein
MKRKQEEGISHQQRWPSTKTNSSLPSSTRMAGPYYSYGGNQAFFNSEYNYHQFNRSNGFVDGFYVRDYSGYGAGYGDYNTSNFSVPQNFPLPQPVLRQRTPTPPPPPAEPSPEYLAASLSAQPSSVPPGQRKLLIFDLNGTLLLRSPRNYGVRRIYLRPYARALVAYIAHPAVYAWLDCMVWSSAQAHNVREMVDRVFGTGEGAGSGPILRAVWARDTLGLGREAFCELFCTIFSSSSSIKMLVVTVVIRLISLLLLLKLSRLKSGL